MNLKKKIKLKTMKINYFMFLVFILFSCQEDNYKECADLTYGTDYIKITGVSESDKNYFKYFCKTTEIFGIKIYATNKVDNEKMLHAASILAEYLDNDEDGQVDNQKVVDKLIEKNVWLLLVKNESDQNDAERINLKNSNYQDLRDEEITLVNGSPRFDASLEEVLHLITQHGYAEVYPEVFGEKKGSKIADAMDIARGGYFKKVPNEYPTNAWYTYNDESCDYSCQITEYTYWALTSILGGQDFNGRFDEIKDEWKLNTKEKVKNNDIDVYNLLTKSEYKLPTKLPNGKYRIP
ncbi:MAG: hypothetical protein CBE28_00740 [Pelagibacteraceae bacterium TMED268]|nr:MAG: hypothetical protein CBE28_00740 [Pelagibacteraceae bacterium TMED268]